MQVLVVVWSYARLREQRLTIVAAIQPDRRTLWMDEKKVRCIISSC